ncbi:MAG: Y-family DNA polymerase [Woeseiaceae bacterium]
MVPSDKSPAMLRDAAPTPGKNARSSITKPVQQALILEPGPEIETTLEERTRTRCLWLCLHFPLLPLEAFRDGSSEARAVFEDRQGERRILLADEPARARGITPGLSVNAALALLPTLELEARHPAREERILKKLAAWAERFTATVSLEPPALLLEIAGSLRLFGGLETLWQRIETGLGQRGYAVSMALAPTPLASLWLARACRNVRIEDTKNLTGTLSPLPLRYLEWPDSVRESLNGMGITCIGDCLRLPREGFVRRFGAGRLLQLDRALGRLPDPRTRYRAPERFCQEWELNEEQHDSEWLLKACRQLLVALERFLTSRQLAIQQLRFDFFHQRTQATHLTLGRREAGGEVERWFELLKIRFERLTLPAPVIAIRLQSGRGEPLLAATDTLPFDRAAGRQGVPVAQLMERLSARVGDASMHGVALVAEHRPHYAWSTVQVAGIEVPQCRAVPDHPCECPPEWLADVRRTHSLLLRRPLWMLSEPLALTTISGKPSYQGPLKLLAGPERLETGWWDGNGIARDYFVAVNPGGVHLWVYRNRGRKTDWYLHGIYG